MTTCPEDKSTLVERSSLRQVILASWASATTALLLVILIGGAFYIKDIKYKCEIADENETKHSHIACEDGEEDIYASQRYQSELYIKKNTEGAVVLIADVDYKKKISATYVAVTDQCYLRSGVDSMDWDDVWELDIQHQDTDKQQHVPDTDGNGGQWNVDYSNRVRDISILPEQMRPFCEGKEIYWLTENDIDADTDSEDQHNGREKRSFFEICINRYLWCKYTLRNEVGHECYHLRINRNNIWRVRYMTRHCKDWALISMSKNKQKQ